MLMPNQKTTIYMNTVIGRLGAASEFLIYRYIFGIYAIIRIYDRFGHARDVCGSIAQRDTLKFTINTAHIHRKARFSMKRLLKQTFGPLPVHHKSRKSSKRHNY